MNFDTNAKYRKQYTEATTWTPQPQQAIALRRSEREIAFGGSRFGGKSECSLAWSCEPEYIQNPLFRGLVIRQDYDDLQDWIIRAKRFYKGLATIVGNPPQIRWKAGGITSIGHWKDTATISKYVGQEFHKILLEEANQAFSSLQEYMMLLGSLRSTVEGLKAQAFLTANPGGIGHAWMKKYFVDVARNISYQDPKTKSRRIFIPSSYKENKIGCAKDPDYVNWLIGLEGNLGKIWRDGDWDAFSGQYFSNFGTHLLEKPFKLEPSKHGAHCRGSLDFGNGMEGVSSFGFWYVQHTDDGRAIPHRCFTHRMVGLTASEQADSLYDYIESFPYTNGIFPIEIWYDNSMDNRARMERGDFAPIDYFKKRFAGSRVRWTQANKARVPGWQIMLDYFGVDSASGCPKMFYWEGYNKSFEENIPLLLKCENNPDDVEKCPIDHEADECRYGLVGIRGRTASALTRNAQKNSTVNLISAHEIIQKGMVPNTIGD